MTVSYLFLPFFLSVFVPFLLTQTARLKWRLSMAVLPVLAVSAVNLLNPQLTITGNIKAILINLAFAGFVSGITIFFRRLCGSHTAFAQFISTAAVLLFSFSVFWLNPVIEAYKNSTVRDTLIHMAVNFNPMVTAYAHGFGADLLRQKFMYNISSIGPYYPYHVADFFTILMYYMVPGAVLAGLACLKPKRPQSKSA